jgi:nicotinate-nucleotide adenylyltransferase
MLEETIGILGGSFNPVHIGHMVLASYLSQWKYVDKVWLTLTPRNPLKDPHNLLPDLKRLAMLHIATKSLSGIETCDIELSMPTPNYTINTLDTLAKRYPAKKFKLVIGSDNWQIFEKWRDWQRILDEYGVIVYPRPGYEVENKNVDGMELVDAPLLNISSTFIRSAIALGRDMSCFVPNGVYKYISDNKLYQAPPAK